jgi:hypothetical protein
VRNNSRRGAVGELDPAPVTEGLGQRFLDEIVGQVPVAAQQVGRPVQRRSPAADELSELLVRGAHRSVACVVI